MYFGRKNIFIPGITPDTMPEKLINNYIPEVAALKFGRRRPDAVSINLTSKCNQQCLYCEIGMGKPSADYHQMDLSDLEWVIDQMAGNRIRQLALCGGEPFLFRDILKLIKYAGERNIRCSVTTNGMTAHQLDEHSLHVLKKFGVSINISIDSFRDEIQCRTRGNKDALKNSVKSLERLHEFDIPVILLCVISKYNYNDLFNYIRTACSKNVKEVLFQPVIGCSNYPDRPPIKNKQHLNVSPEKIEILLEELRMIMKFERNHNIKTNVYRLMPWIGNYLETINKSNGHWFFTDIVKKFYCRELFSIIEIDYNGNIHPCALLPANKNIFDNRQQGLIVNWMDATHELKIQMEEGQFHAECNACCNHFSRNMLASVIRYPVRNRMALLKLLPLLSARLISRIIIKRTHL